MTDGRRDVEVVEVVPGDYEVRLAGRRYRVLVPAGIGVPGVGDNEFAGTVVQVLADRGAPIPAVVDVSAVLRSDPGLLQAVSEHHDLDS